MACCASTNGVLGVEIGPPKTIREALDREIARSRQELEKKCIAKGKLDTLGFLDLPYAELRHLLGWVM